MLGMKVSEVLVAAKALPFWRVQSLQGKVKEKIAKWQKSFLISNYFIFFYFLSFIHY